MNPTNTKVSVCPACGARIIPRFGMGAVLFIVFVALPVVSAMIEYLLGFFLSSYIPSAMENLRLLTFLVVVTALLATAWSLNWYKIENGR